MVANQSASEVCHQKYHGYEVQIVCYIFEKIVLMK